MELPLPDLSGRSLKAFKKMNNDGSLWINFDLVWKTEKTDQGWMLYHVGGGDPTLVPKHSTVATWLEKYLPTEA